jgi:hypothetical protein
VVAALTLVKTHAPEGAYSVVVVNVTFAHGRQRRCMPVPVPFSVDDLLACSYCSSIDCCCRCTAPDVVSSCDVLPLWHVCHVMADRSSVDSAGDLTRV